MRFTKLSRWALACTVTLGASCIVAPPIVHAQDSAQSQANAPKEKDNDRDVRTNAALWATIKNPVLWHTPGDIASLDLFYGQGGKDKLPKPPFTFVSEDMNGTNPKLDVRDANDKKWRVKEGEEAQPEVVASRLLWAMGYFANDDYLIPAATVSGVKMKRGSNELKAGTLTNARFSRKPSGQNKIGIWEWKTGPFYGTKEFNGLRVMMAVINNWDLKDVNNAVFADTKNNRQIFLVSDVGATFGSNGVSWTKSRSKGNLDSFRNSSFIEHKTDSTVSFGTPKRPTGILLATLGTTAKSFAMRKDLDWIGHDIPLADARWIGGMLAQLTHQQLEDAFRAGNFPQEEADAYVQIIEARISDLKNL